MPKIRSLLFVGLSLVVTWACGNAAPSDPEGGAEVTIEMPDGSFVTGRVARAPVDGDPGAATLHAATPADAHPAVPPGAEPISTEPEVAEVEVPAGTTLSVTLDSTVASNISQVEDLVQARVARSVSVDGVLVIPEGTVAHGTVTTARPSNKVKGRAQLAFRFDGLDIAGEWYALQSEALWYQADSNKTEDAKKIGIGAGAGAVIGGLFGGGKGAGTGAAIGGGAGTAMVLATAGDEVELRPGESVEVKLTQPLVVVVPMTDGN